MGLPRITQVRKKQTAEEYERNIHHLPVPVIALDKMRLKDQAGNEYDQWVVLVVENNRILTWLIEDVETVSVDWS